jgi:hypothetical protein
MRLSALDRLLEEQRERDRRHGSAYDEEEEFELADRLAGAHDVAYLGYVVVGLAREPLRGRSCRGRLVRRGTSS